MRGLYFDKLPEANWKVPWHQDLSIAVRARLDVEGFGPWTEKAGVLHAQAPAAVLERMLAVRVHLDDCGRENGKSLPPQKRVYERAFCRLQPLSPRGRSLDLLGNWP